MRTYRQSSLLSSEANNIRLIILFEPIISPNNTLNGLLETGARRPNEQLSEWAYDEPFANTCENYKVPCHVMVPTVMMWCPHCVIKLRTDSLKTSKRPSHSQSLEISQLIFSSHY